MKEFAPQAADLLLAAFRLADALRASDPALDRALQAGPLRVAFDLREGIVLLSTVQPDGTPQPVVAVHADPNDRDTFGAAGVPAAVEGLYAAAPTRH